MFTPSSIISFKFTYKYCTNQGSQHKIIVLRKYHLNEKKPANRKKTTCTIKRGF
jgi:hypothetical protein